MRTIKIKVISGYIKEILSKKAEEENYKGYYDLSNYLFKEGFYTAPASIKHHLNIEGGLITHSWLVYEFMQELNDRFDAGIPEESIFIEGIFHDLCKINVYKKEQDTEAGKPTEKQVRYLDHLIKKSYELPAEFDYKETVKSKQATSKWISYLKGGGEIPEIEDTVNYIYDDDLPLGHGEKSVILLQKFIPVREREMLAIRWHMGPWEESVVLGNNRSNYNKAGQNFSDVGLLGLADGMATIYEDHNEIKIEH